MTKYNDWVMVTVAVFTFLFFLSSLDSWLATW
jgi:hypothetical protein